MKLNSLALALWSLNAAPRVTGGPVLSWPLVLSHVRSSVIEFIRERIQDKRDYVSIRNELENAWDDLAKVHGFSVPSSSAFMQIQRGMRYSAMHDARVDAALTWSSQCVNTDTCIDVEHSSVQMNAWIKALFFATNAKNDYAFSATVGEIKAVAEEMNRGTDATLQQLQGWATKLSCPPIMIMRLLDWVSKDSLYETLLKSPAPVWHGVPCRSLEARDEASLSTDFPLKRFSPQGPSLDAMMLVDSTGTVRRATNGEVMATRCGELCARLPTLTEESYVVFVSHSGNMKILRFCKNGGEMSITSVGPPCVLEMQDPEADEDAPDDDDSKSVMSRPLATHVTSKGRVDWITSLRDAEGVLMIVWGGRNVLTGGETWMRHLTVSDAALTDDAPSLEDLYPSISTSFEDLEGSLFESILRGGACDLRDHDSVISSCTTMEFRDALPPSQLTPVTIVYMGSVILGHYPYAVHGAWGVPSLLYLNTPNGVVVIEKGVERCATANKSGANVCAIYV